MRRKRTLWLILLAIPLLVVGADTVYWYVIEQNLEQDFGFWLAEQRAAGWTANMGRPVRGGWPLAATLSVPAVSLQGGEPDIPGGLAWGAQELLLRVNLLRPTVLEVAPRGAQHVRLADGPDLPYTAGRLRVTMPLAPDPQSSWVALEANDLRVVLPWRSDATAALGIGELGLRADVSPTAAAGAPAVGVSLHAEAIDAPSEIARLLGPRIASIALEGALGGPMPTMRSITERAAAWRDAGGSLEIKRLTLNWGPLDLSATGTLALDDELQPMGAGSAHIVGYAETLDALAAHGMLSKSAGTAAKAVLSLLAHSPDDGSPPDVDVPLTLQYRTLAMRQVPLLRLPEIAWP